MIESLGVYKILDRLGSGGMGDVYRARDTRHGRTVAIKLLPPSIADDPDRRESFLRDAHAAAVLSHPNIVTLYEVGEDAEVGEDGEHLFLVFDFVPGETLKTTIAGRPLNLRRALDLAAQIADGLAEAHAAGVAHRDLRPENIIVTPKGAAKILDIGLSAWTNGGTAAQGGPCRAPEHGREDADERADVFSLGVVLYEMLTGAPPPGPIAEPWPPELDAIVLKALARSVERRYEMAVSMAADLRTLILMIDVRAETRELASEHAAAPIVRGPRRRSRAGWIALVVVAALAALAWALYFS